MSALKRLGKIEIVPIGQDRSRGAIIFGKHLEFDVNHPEEAILEFLDWGIFTLQQERADRLAAMKNRGIKK